MDKGGVKKLDEKDYESYIKKMMEKDEIESTERSSDE